MHAMILVTIWLPAALWLGTGASANDLPPGTICRQEIRAIDDQADVDMRDVNRLIALLEDELGDRAIASGGQQDRLRARLDAAKLRRVAILDKQHDDLNTIRARCDRMRNDAERGVDRSGTAGSMR
jgi:hypothetical protein